MNCTNCGEELDSKEEKSPKRMKSEKEEKRREEACKRAGCNEDMFCYGGKACYDLCDKAMGLMKRN